MAQENAQHGTAAFDFIEAIAALENPDAVVDAFRREAGRFGYSTFAIGELPRHDSAELPPFFVATWPKSWIDVYVGEKLLEVDPTVFFARSSTLPATWSELRERYPGKGARALYAAMAHDWPEGLTIPVHGPHGYQGVVSLGGETRDLPVRARTALHLMALYLHERLKQLLAPHLAEPPQNPPKLTRGEIECIRRLIAGKTDWEIGEILHIAEATAHWRIEQAKRKLGVKTRAQLTALAVHHGLVRP